MLKTMEKTTEKAQSLVFRRLGSCSYEAPIRGLNPDSRGSASLPGEYTVGSPCTVMRRVGVSLWACWRASISS